MFAAPAPLIAFRFTRPLALDRLDSFLAAERGRFLPWVPVLMAAGSAWYFALPAEPDQRFGLLLIPLIAAAILLRRQPVPCGVAIALAAMLAGFSAGSLATLRQAAPEPMPSRAVVLQAKVGLVEILPDKIRLTLDAPIWAEHPAPLAQSVRVTLRADDKATPQAGDVVRLRAMLRPPAAPAYPGAWDLQRDAFYAGRGGGGWALGHVEIVQSAQPSGLARLRQGLAARFMAGLPGVDGTIAATLFTGLASAIPPTDRAAFRDSGLAHLLAVAGLHIGAVMGAVFFALRAGLAWSERASLRLPCRQIAAGGALAVGFAYLLLTGAHVPIQRSFAMAVLVTLGVFAGRRAMSLRGLSFAAIAILLVTPEQVVGVSFQMSFAAVLALIAGFEASRPWLLRLRRARHGRVLAYAAGLSLTSLLAGAASAPFGAYHFGQIQLYFVLANLVAVPITAVFVMPLGLVALALMPLGLEQIALWPMGWGIAAILAIGRFVSSLPEATIAVRQMPGWGLGCVALGIAWIGIWRSRVRLVGLAPLALGLLSVVLATPPDLLVDGDGRLVGLRGPAGVALQTSPGAQHFVENGWLQAWGARAAIPGCADQACLLAPREAGPAVLLVRGQGQGDCTKAVLVITLGAARAPCPGLPTIDRAQLMHDGALAIRLADTGPIIVSDRDWRGARPWMPPTGPRSTLQRPVPRSTLPPALTEELRPEAPAS